LLGTLVTDPAKEVGFAETGERAENDHLGVAVGLLQASSLLDQAAQEAGCRLVYRSDVQGRVEQGGTSEAVVGKRVIQ
jgi:hypothetical protein